MLQVLAMSIHFVGSSLYEPRGLVDREIGGGDPEGTWAVWAQPLVDAFWTGISRTNISSRTLAPFGLIRLHRKLSLIQQRASQGRTLNSLPFVHFGT